MLINNCQHLLELTLTIQNHFVERNLTLATAESCTGGLLASLLTHYPGSSQFYRGGVSAYSNGAKTTFLGVDAKLIEEHGSVSEPVAKAMAAGALAKFNADFAISVTGIAGPGGGTVEKPVGTIFVGLAQTMHQQVFAYQLGGDRLDNRSAIVKQALASVLTSVTKK